MKRSEQEWAYEYMRGNEKALEWFFKTLNNQLLGYARRIVLEKEIAEDIVSESWVKFWYYREKFNDTNYNLFKSWLYIVVHNGCLNKINKLKKEKENLTKLKKSSNECDSFSVEEKIELSEELINMRKYIDKLPTECQKIMGMIYDGMNMADIARLLKLRPTTVRNQFKTGKDKLLKMISSGNLASPTVSILNSHKRETEFIFENH